LKAMNSVLTRTFRYFFIKKEGSEIFEWAQNYLWHVTIGSCKKIFSPIGQNLTRFFLGRMKNQRFSKKCQRPPEKKFSLNLCLAILGILFVVKKWAGYSEEGEIERESLLCI
jgi:hypothetical protein